MPEDDNNTEATEPKIDSSSINNHVGKVILPVSEQADSDNQKDKNKDEITEKQVEPEPTKPKPVEAIKESPLSTDLNIDRAISTAPTDLQQPRIYDTKQYYVPINDTKHKHGFLVGTIIAGVVTAVIAVSVLAFISMSA